MMQDDRPIDASRPNFPPLNELGGAVAALPLTPVSSRCQPVEGIALPALPSLLWVDLSAPLTSDEWSDLSAEEHDQAERFRCVRDQRRYLAAHAALRRALAAHGAGEPHSLRFDPGTWGKPALCDSGGLRFNLSHSDDIGLIGTSFSHDVGVDVECIRTLPDVAMLVNEHFTAAERDEFACLPPHAKDRAFLIGWTRKEACLKAIGLGLHIAPQGVDVGLDACPGKTQVVFGERWYDVAVQSIAHKQGWVGAVAQVLSQGALGTGAPIATQATMPDSAPPRPAAAARTGQGRAVRRVCSKRLG